jgi:hypothetical protein
MTVDTGKEALTAIRSASSLTLSRNVVKITRFLKSLVIDQAGFFPKVLPFVVAT